MCLFKIYVLFKKVSYLMFTQFLVPFLNHTNCPCFRSASSQPSERVPLDPSVKVSSSMEAFRHPYYRGMFLYILRDEAGTGDTIDRYCSLQDRLELTDPRPPSSDLLQHSITNTYNCLVPTDEVDCCFPYMFLLSSLLILGVRKKTTSRQLYMIIWICLL